MKKVLAVDDQEVILKTLQAMVTMIGCEITTATNSKQALEHLEKEQFNICFIDVVMGAESGIDLVRKILKRIPKQKIILMSGTALAEEIPKDLINQLIFLPKPFTLTEIKEIIKNV